MTDPVSTADPTKEAGGASPIEMAQLSQQRYEEEAQRVEFDNLAQRAISVAIDRPGGAGHVSETRDTFMGGRAGSVGEAKAELVSDVARPGTEPSVEENKSVEETLEVRMLTLYSDLTDYQVAWRIAQKIPQDLSQILKGS